MRAGRNDRGAAAVVVAILVAVLAGFLALALDTGHVMAVRGQLQNATDAAALAAAQELNGTVEGLAAARAMAQSFTARHQTDRDMPVLIDPQDDVVFGSWDAGLPRAQAFTPIADVTPQALRLTNAVLVRAGREAPRGNPVQVVMGELLGKSFTDVRAESVAVLGGPSREECVVPLAFASCVVVDPVTGKLNCGSTLRFQNDLQDNIGFTNLTLDPTVSTADLRTILGDYRSYVSCMKGSSPSACTCPRPVQQYDPEVGCVSSLVSHQGSSCLAVSNGANLTPLVTDFKTLDPGGLPIDVRVPIVDLGQCPAKFNEHPGGAPITGFATIVIKAVSGGSEKYIEIEIDCTSSSTGSAGGNFLGTRAARPRLVR